jgi:hypothetical protein
VPSFRADAKSGVTCRENRDMQQATLALYDELITA